jgi:hypothetical protein
MFKRIDVIAGVLGNLLEEDCGGNRILKVMLPGSSASCPVQHNFNLIEAGARVFLREDGTKGLREG